MTRRRSSSSEGSSVVIVSFIARFTVIVAHFDGRPTGGIFVLLIGSGFAPVILSSFAAGISGAVAFRAVLPPSHSRQLPVIVVAAAAAVFTFSHYLLGWCYSGLPSQ